jgi:pimeloyl-ACP methyl ester carboxylesterase
MMVKLASTQIDGERPERGILFLHGILGRGTNLRSLAKRFVEARPEFTSWLMDLRGHGQSPKNTPNASLNAAAADVTEFARNAPWPITAIVGHSFGGKVALEAARIADLPSLEHVVLIDSAPGARSPGAEADSAIEVIDTLESLPSQFASRTAFVDALIEKGKSRQLAQWLAGSLQTTGDYFQFTLDLREIRTLIMDYFARDLWPVVERPPGKVRVHLTIGDRSTVYSHTDRNRVRVFWPRCSNGLISGMNSCRSR